MNNFLKLLSIDTSTDACSVALLNGNRLKEHFELTPKSHARLLLSMIDNLLKESECTLEELDVLAFGRGPGSFTGVRIASSVIQALGYGLNKPIVPVSTLRAIAQRAYQEDKLSQSLVYLDARMGEVYWGLFELGAEAIMQPVSEEKVQPLNQILLPNDQWNRITGFPHAEDIARIAEYEFRLGHTVTAEDAIPVYVRNEVASLPK